jgi:hypothetical protein
MTLAALIEIHEQRIARRAISDERRRRIRPQGDNVSTQPLPGRNPELRREILQARIREHLGYTDRISAQYLPEIHDNINRRGAGGMARLGIYPHSTPRRRGGNRYTNITTDTNIEEGMLTPYKITTYLEGDKYNLAQGTIRQCGRWAWDHLDASPWSLALDAWERRTQPRRDS